MNRFKRTLFCLIFLFPPLLCCSHAFAANSERALRMDVDVHVSPTNATLTVTERIAFVTDRQDAQGLFRRVLGEWELGKERVKTIFNVVSATQDGEKVPYRVREVWPYVHIHIGGDGHLQPGRTYEYVLQNTITDLVQFRKKADWLYWSVAGSGVFPIESASFRIFLPDGATIREQDAWTGTTRTAKTRKKTGGVRRQDGLRRRGSSRPTRYSSS